MYTPVTMLMYQSLALLSDSGSTKKTMEEDKLKVIFKASGYPNLVRTDPFLLFLCGDSIIFWIFHKFVCSLLCLFSFYPLVNNLSMRCYSAVISYLFEHLFLFMYECIYWFLFTSFFFHNSQWER